MWGGPGRDAEATVGGMRSHRAHRPRALEGNARLWRENASSARPTRVRAGEGNLPNVRLYPRRH